MMRLYARGYTKEREELVLQRLKTLEQILILSDNHYTVAWMYLYEGDLTVGFNTGGSIVPLSAQVIRAWHLIRGVESPVSIIYDIGLGVEIEKVIKNMATIMRDERDE